MRGWTAAWILALLLAGCGGGGGDAPAGEPTTMPALQGNLVPTNRALDLAISGAGLFAFVADDGGAVYSRAGRLDVDRDGRLVHAEGWRLAGRAGDADPDDRAAAMPALPYTIAGSASTRVQIEAILDSRQPLVGTGTPFDAVDPGTYHGATSLTIHDAEGRPAALTLYFVRTATDRWDVHATAAGATPLGRVAQLGFTAPGQFDPASSSAPPFDIPALADAPAGATLPIPGLSIDWSGVVSFGANFAVRTLGSDGYPPGRLQAVEVDRDGRFSARYDNGQQRPAGQLLLARFALGDELQRVGASGLRCVVRCAAPIVAPPREMLLGEVVSGALEQQP